MRISVSFLCNNTCQFYFLEETSISAVPVPAFPVFIVNKHRSGCELTGVIYEFTHECPNLTG